MDILLTDETNLAPKEHQFFIYGGVAISGGQVARLHDGVQKIRQKYDFAAGASLKFSNQESHDVDAHRRAKRATFKLMRRCDARLLCSVVLERVLRPHADSPQIYVGWALNAVTMAYHEMLKREDRRGVLLMDRVDSKQVNFALQEHSDRFQKGLQFPSGYSRPVSDRIVAFGMTSNNASHLSSCTDIAIGTLAYCMNAVAGVGGAKMEVASKMAPLLRPIWWRPHPRRSTPDGYIPRPKDQWVGDVRARYADMSRGLRVLGAM